MPQTVEQANEVDKTPRPNVRNGIAHLFNQIWWTVFLLTFCAEWGDPSQLSIVAFSANADIWGSIFLNIYNFD